MSSCKQFEDQAIDYVCELLPKAQAVTFEQHLKGCDACTKAVQSLAVVLRVTDEAQAAVTLPALALQDIEMNVYKRLAATPPMHQQTLRSRVRSYVATVSAILQGHRTAAVGTIAIALIAIAVFIGNPFQPKAALRLTRAQSADARMEQYRQRDIQRSLEEALITHHVRNDTWETASQFQRMKEQAHGTNWVKVANKHLQRLQPGILNASSTTVLSD